MWREKCVAWSLHTLFLEHFFISGGHGKAQDSFPSSISQILALHCGFLHHAFYLKVVFKYAYRILKAGCLMMLILQWLSVVLRVMVCTRMEWIFRLTTVSFICLRSSLCHPLMFVFKIQKTQYLKNKPVLTVVSFRVALHLWTFNKFFLSYWSFPDNINSLLLLR